MSIFPHPLLLVFFSCLLCPVASQTGHYGPKEVKSGFCTSAELIKSAADCTAAGKLLFGFRGTAETVSYSDYPPGCVILCGDSSCVWSFNTIKASTTACADGTSDLMCLCVDPCPIGNYQNEESSKTCKSCLPGTYNDKTGQALCKEKCNIGQYSTEVGLTSDAACRSCQKLPNFLTRD